MLVVLVATGVCWAHTLVEKRGGACWEQGRRESGTQGG